MTALEFVAAGVVIQAQRGGGYRVDGPVDKRELLDELRFEVATRVELVGDGDYLPKGDYRAQAYRCDFCGDPIGHDRKGSCVLCPDRCRRQIGGMCDLCALARHKALKARPK
jgi:hypothetical protein